MVYPTWPTDFGSAPADPANEARMRQLIAAVGGSLVPRPRQAWEEAAYWAMGCEERPDLVEADASTGSLHDSASSCEEPDCDGEANRKWSLVGSGRWSSDAEAVDQRW